MQKEDAFCDEHHEYQKRNSSEFVDIIIFVFKEKKNPMVIMNFCCVTNPNKWSKKERIFAVFVVEKKSVLSEI